MVWCVQNYLKNYCRRGAYFGFEVEADHIFQSMNVIYDLHNISFDAYDIKSLVLTGVNIFNVDLSVHDRSFFEKVKAVIKETTDIFASSPSIYYRPIGLSMTLSVLNPFDFDEEVDILILKDVAEKEQLLEFKKRNKNFASMPILLRLAEFRMEEANELIKISDGIIVDLVNVNFFDEACDDLTQMCRKAGKPCYYLIPRLAEDYYELEANDRKILTLASQLSKNYAYGVVIEDSIELNKPPADAILALVKATRVFEDNEDKEKIYLKLSFEMEIPVLPPLSTAMAASLGALKVGAKAIIIMTKTGRSARVMSSAAPPCIVLAITTNMETARRMHLYRKVVPLFYKKPCAHNWHQEWRNRVDFGTDFGLKTGLFCTGAKLVVLAPSEEGTGYCDGFQIVAVPFRCD